MWDQAPVNDASHIISAIDIYESSAKHDTVMKATEEAFSHKAHLFMKAKWSWNPVKSAFAEQLAQIALENRLCMSHLMLVSIQICLTFDF